MAEVRLTEAREVSLGFDKFEEQIKRNLKEILESTQEKDMLDHIKYLYPKIKEKEEKIILSTEKMDFELFEGKTVPLYSWDSKRNRSLSWFRRFSSV